MSQVLGEVDDIFNEQGDIVVTDEETDMPPTPLPRGEAGDGLSQQRQLQRRRLEPGTKRGPYKRVAPDARKRILDVYRAGGDRKWHRGANRLRVYNRAR